MAIAALALQRFRSMPRATEVTASGDPALVRLRFIESLYRDLFRAESEMLRFLHDAPADPRRDTVELARAMLYFHGR